MTILPLSVVILVLGAEYGNGLMTREALDSAVRDVTRMLARAPLDVDTSGGTPKAVVYPWFRDQAEIMIAERTGRSVDDIALTVTVTEVDPGQTLRTPFLVVTTEVELGVDLPLISVVERFTAAADAVPGDAEPNAVKRFLTMSSYDRARYSIDSCTDANRALGICPGS